MKKLESVTLDRYECGDYIMEVEEKHDEESGLMWDFWLYRKNYGVKDYMFGLITNQPCENPPKVYTKEEFVELALANIDEYISGYAAEYEEA